MNMAGLLLAYHIRRIIALGGTAHSCPGAGDKWNIPINRVQS